MEKPGVERAIPGAIMGVVGGILLAYFLRWVSSIEPYWDYNLILVIVPFSMMAGWMWGIGAFNPKFSEHVHPPGEHDEHEAHHEEEEIAVGSILMNQIWKITTYSLLLFIIFFAFAEIPNGFFLRLSNNAEASVGDFAQHVAISIPVVEWEFETSQVWLFIVMVAATIIPMALMGGVLGFLFYMGHRQVLTVTSTEPTMEELTPPAPVRFIGRIASGIASGLREGLPRFFGMK